MLFKSTRVPSRMNIGQILEVHLGLVVKDWTQIQNILKLKKLSFITELRAKMIELHQLQNLMNVKAFMEKLSDDDLIKLCKIGQKV